MARQKKSSNLPNGKKYNLYCSCLFQLSCSINFFIFTMAISRKPSSKVSILMGSNRKFNLQKNYDSSIARYFLFPLSHRENFSEQKPTDLILCNQKFKWNATLSRREKPCFKKDVIKTSAVRSKIDSVRHTC